MTDLRELFDMLRYHPQGVEKEKSMLALEVIADDADPVSVAVRAIGEGINKIVSSVRVKGLHGADGSKYRGRRRTEGD